jgi:hypothetical protein
MHIANSSRRAGAPPAAFPHPVSSSALFAGWLAAVIYLTIHYVVGRDDVRALSLAISGSNVIAMLHGLHGEGHPALWYLLLRGIHFLFNSPHALQMAAIAVSAAAACVLLVRSPFHLITCAIILAGQPLLIEYTVIPRDYGIAMLLVFVFAALYPEHRSYGCWLGLVLLLLANSHLLSLVLVASLLLFWLLDILLTPLPDRSSALRTFALNSFIALAGVLLCVKVSLPTYNDAAQLERPVGGTLALLANALFIPAHQFNELILPGFMRHAGKPAEILISILMFGCILGLIRRPAAFVAAIASLVGLSIFFAFLANGAYRHQALWLVLLIGLYWMAQERDPQAPASSAPSNQWIQRIALAGKAFFFVLLGLQVVSSLHLFSRIALDPYPSSRSADLGALIQSTPQFHNAIVIADPDYLAEPLPYYVANPVYLMREARFDTVVHFTRHARLQLSLLDVLNTARTLNCKTGRPVLILLDHPLLPGGEQIDREGYDWTFSMSPDQVLAFQASTQLIRHFGPVTGDETYDVYEFNPAPNAEIFHAGSEVRH